MRPTSIIVATIGRVALAVGALAKVLAVQLVLMVVWPMFVFRRG